MKSIWTVVIALLLVLGCTGAKAQDTTPLTALQPVLGRPDYRTKKFSMDSTLFNYGLTTFNTHRSAYIYDLDGLYTRFEASIGMPDDVEQFKDRRYYSIFLDGNLIKSGSFIMDEKFNHVILDVTGAKALRLELDYWVTLGEPLLYKDSAQPSSVANLVAPRDGTKLTADSVSLLWEPVDGAIKYGVEIVCTKGDSPSIYALNATDSTTKFDLTSIPNGEYQWSVIAFNSKGVIGKFSKDRSFTVAR